MISWLWIQLYEFIHEFIHLNLDIWFHDILHDHEFMYEFALWIHIWIHNFEFIYEFMVMNSYATFLVAWIHIWIHENEEYREIIPEIMWTKVPEAELFIFSPVTPVRVQVQVDSLPVVLIESRYFRFWHSKSFEVWAPVQPDCACQNDLDRSCALASSGF